MGGAAKGSSGLRARQRTAKVGVISGRSRRGRGAWYSCRCSRACDWLFCTGTIVIHADDTSSRIKNKQSKGRGTREHRALDGEMKLVGLPNATQTYEHIVRLKSSKNDGGSYRDGGSSRDDYSTSDSD